MRAYIYDLRAASHMAFTQKAAQPSAEKLKNGELLVRVHSAALNPVE